MNEFALVLLDVTLALLIIREFFCKKVKK